MTLKIKQFNATAPYLSGGVQKSQTACEEQTMIRCIGNREFHAPTRCFIKVG